MDEKEVVFNKGDKVSWIDTKQSRGHFTLSFKKGEAVKDEGEYMVKVKYRNGKETLIEKRFVKIDKNNDLVKGGIMRGSTSFNTDR